MILYTKKFFRFLLFLLFTGFVIQPVAAQSKFTLDPGLDLMSRYIWRGLDFGNSPAIQPALELTNKKFTVGAWGSYATNDANFQEADLYVSYTLKELFTFTVTDYFFPDGDTSENKYFDYQKDETGHVFEGAVSFNGTEKVPLSLMVATNFYGDDARKVNDKIQYSTYIELKYSRSIGPTDFDLFIGGTPNKPDRDKGETGYYGPYEGIINVGLTAVRKIAITDKFDLPLTVSLITNPQLQNIFIVAGFSF